MKRFYTPFFFLIPGVLCLCFLCACISSSEISIRRNPFRNSSVASNVFEQKTHGLLQYHINFLNSHLAMDRFETDTPGLLRDLEKEFEQEKSINILEVLTDVAFCKARLASDKAEALSYYLSSAEYAYHYLSLYQKNPKTDIKSLLDPGSFSVLSRYNDAVAEIFITLRDYQLLNKDSYQFKNATGETIVFQKPDTSRLPFAFDEFQKFELCADFIPENLNFFSFRLALGVPLMAIPDLKKITLHSASFMPKLTLPVTAILHFPNAGRKQTANFQQAHLELVWTDRNWETVLDARQMPLSLDYSTPLAYQMHQAAFNVIPFMLNPNQTTENEGLFLTEPFAPDKIPVVFVHGLMSSAQTWAQLFNTLRNDSVIRKNYQFWFYSYSTGTPVLFSAKNFRTALDRVYASFPKDPASRANFEKMIVVGHSMGGLLAKTLILEPNQAIVQKLFLRNEEELLAALPPETKTLAADLFEFKRRPYVSRMVFMATPHRGSNLASMWIGRLGSKLVRMPIKMLNAGVSMLDLYKQSAADRKYKNISTRTGIDNLEPKDPAMNILAELPYPEGIPYHSVIGNKKEGGVPAGTDGIVPYTSAHLNGAASELVVKSGHSVQCNPLAALEIRRILLLHLKELGKLDPQ